MTIFNCKEKEMIPLTYEENRSYKEQEACHICQEKFCMDKNDKNYIKKGRLKIIVIKQEKLKELFIVNVIWIAKF